MAIGRITGSVLKSNLTRNGTDLAFETNLLYLDVTNSRVGIGTSEPTTALQVNGTITATTVAGATDLNLSAAANGDINIPANIGLTFGNDGEKIEGDGTNLKIASSGTTTLDSVGNIILDADSGGTVIIADNGTSLMKMFQFGNFVAVESMIANKDFHIRGNDGGSYIDALIFDMSEAGAATFNSTIATTGLTINSAYTLPTTDGNNGQVLQTDGNGTIIFAESGGGGGGNNTAIQQTNYYKLGTSTKVIDEFDLTEYRGAVYDISMDDHVNSLVGHVKVTLLHDGSTPYISIYDVNEDSTNICIFTTAISGTKLQLKANTNGSTNTDIKMRRVALGDHHETVANTNSKIIATSTAISSSATTLDQFTKTDLQSAKYVVLFKDSTQNEYQMNEVSIVHDGTNVFFNFYGGVSSRADFPFTLSAAISGATVTVSATSTGGTTATAILYRLDLGSKTKFGNFDDTEFKKIHDQDSTVATVDEFDVFKYDTARYFISIANAGDTEYQNSEIVLTTNSAKTGATISESIVRTGTTTLATFTADVSSGKARLRMAGTSANNVVYIARTAVEKELIHYASDHTSNDVFIKANNLVVDDTTTEFKVDKITQSSHSDFVSRQYVLFGTTSNNTETEIFVGGVSNSRIPIATNSTMNYTLDITARRTDADGYSAGYQLKGVVDNNSGTVADVGDVYEIIIAEDDADLTIDATADNTNKSLKVTVTGQSGHTYKWMCAVKTYEVIE